MYVSLTKQVLPIRVKVKVGLGNKKGYLYIPLNYRIEPRHRIQFSVRPRTPLLWGGTYSSTGDAICVFYASLTRQTDICLLIANDCFC